MQFYYSKPKILKNLAFVLVLLFFFSRQFNVLVWLYFFVPLFVFVLWGIFTMFRTKEPILVIDENGILDNSKSGYGLIPWEEITSLEVMKTNIGGVLTIQVLDKTKYVDRASAFRRFFINLLGSHMNIYFTQISPELKDAWEYLKVNYADKIGEAKYENPRKLKTFTWKFLVFYLVIFAISMVIVMYFHLESNTNEGKAPKVVLTPIQ